MPERQALSAPPTSLQTACSIEIFKFGGLLNQLADFFFFFGAETQETPEFLL